jgi:hypothetical protein
MAEENEREKGFFEKAGNVVAAAYNAVMEGGEIQAAGLQGAHELGAALKAFPDSIQVNEPGTVFNPLYRDRQSESSPSLPSPSDIADGMTAAPEPSPPPLQPSPPEASQQNTAARGEASSVHGQGGGIQGPEHLVYGPEHGIYGSNMAHSPQAVDAATLGALPSPSEIADGTGPQAPSGWAEKIVNDRKGNQDGNADNNQNEQNQSVPMPGQEQDQGRGRGR